MDLDFQVFDADNHYYEAEDAFTRYASERMKREKFVRWLVEADGKRRRLLFGSREANVIGNPTFNPIAKPGIFNETLKKIEAGEEFSAAAFGELVPIDPAYRDRDMRLVTMDKQGVERTFMFPTLGVTVESLLSDDADILYECFHAFNEWLDDDWGFAYQNRIYAAPVLSMLDLDRAIAELEWVLERGARIVTIRPGPAYGRSPAHPYFDPFWARINEARVVVAYHAFDGPSAYGDMYRQLWNARPQPLSMEHVLFERVLMNSNVIMDTLQILVQHNLFGRFPEIRIASIELGASWVPYLLHRLDHAGGLVNRNITAFGQPLPARPSEIFKEHVWVSPFPEEDIGELAAAIGPERVLFGSDWPHAEGTPEPVHYADALKGFDEVSVRQIMRDNALGLVTA